MNEQNWAAWGVVPSRAVTVHPHKLYGRYWAVGLDHERTGQFFAYSDASVQSHTLSSIEAAIAVSRTVSAVSANKPMALLYAGTATNLRTKLTALIFKTVTVSAADAIINDVGRLSVGVLRCSIANHLLLSKEQAIVIPPSRYGKDFIVTFLGGTALHNIWYKV